MKKALFLLLLAVAGMQAQVGINNNDPQAALDISPSSSATPQSDDGLLIPRLNGFPATNPAAAQNSMIIYLNNNLTGVNINGTPKDYSAGFYFWDNTLTDWISFLGDKGWKLTGNTITATDFIGSLNNQPFNIHVNNTKRISVTNAGQIIHHNPNSATLIGNSTVAGLRSIAIGEAATANATVESVAIGNGANVTFDRAVAIGKTASANNQQTVAVGYLAIASGNNSSAYGNNAKSIGGNSVAIGNAAESSGPNASALGIRATAAGSNGIAIGVDCSAPGSAGIAIGLNAVSSGSSSAAVGGGSMATATQAQAFGAAANASSSRTLALGYGAIASGNNSTAMGYQATTAGFENATAIGNGAVILAANTIRLGNAAVTSVITSGNMRANTFISNSMTYPDYVFEDYFKGFSKIKSDYKFKTLGEAEAFVKEYGHLPGVKSYEEIKEGGFKLDLNEATVTNLEKIEEQFLYITELNKTIKVQQEKIKSLEERLEKIETLLEK